MKLDFNDVSERCSWKSKFVLLKFMKRNILMESHICLKVIKICNLSHICLKVVKIFNFFKCMTEKLINHTGANNFMGVRKSAF